MRNFYKVLAGAPDIPLVTEIMHRQAELFDEKGFSKELPQMAKMLALGITQVTNSLGLEKAELRRIDHDKKDVWGNEPSFSHYIKILNGQVMCMIGDECPAMNTGEWWWVNPAEDAIIINKSGDDALLLYVTTRIA